MTMYTADIVEFMTELADYYTSQLSSYGDVCCFVTPSLLPQYFEHMAPPLLPIKDAGMTPLDSRGCEWRCKFQLKPIVEIILDYASDSILGRPDTSTYYGVLYLTQLILGYSSSSNLRDGLTLTNTTVSNHGLPIVAGSETVLHGEEPNAPWQGQLITLTYDLKVVR